MLYRPLTLFVSLDLHYTNLAISSVISQSTWLCPVSASGCGAISTASVVHRRTTIESSFHGYIQGNGLQKKRSVEENLPAGFRHTKVLWSAARIRASKLRLGTGEEQEIRQLAGHSVVTTADCLINLGGRSLSFSQIHFKPLLVHPKPRREQKGKLWDDLTCWSTSKPNHNVLRLWGDPDLVS